MLTIIVFIHWGPRNRNEPNAGHAPAYGTPYRANGALHRAWLKSSFEISTVR